MSRFRRRTSTMASLVLAIVISSSVAGPAAAQVDTANEQMMNLVLQIQQLQDEIRMLRGQLEEQSFEIEDLKRRQRDQYLDLDQRISELSDARPVSSTRTPPQVTTPRNLEPAVGPGATTEPVQEAPEIVQRGAEAPSAVSALPAPSTDTSATMATPEMEQAAYDEAFQALKELRYADAAESFQSFLQRYPDSSLAGNAQYWLGESYYVTRNYEIALDAFQDLLDQYPDSTKRGDGLLKIGFTHYELKEYDQARSALQQVQQEFPNSTLARLAESRLRSMRLEGHL